MIMVVYESEYIPEEWHISINQSINLYFVKQITYTVHITKYYITYARSLKLKKLCCQRVLFQGTHPHSGPKAPKSPDKLRRASQSRVRLSRVSA